MHANLLIHVKSVPGYISHGHLWSSLQICNEFMNVLSFGRLGLMVAGDVVLASFMTYAEEHLAISAFNKGQKDRNARTRSFFLATSKFCTYTIDPCCIVVGLYTQKEWWFLFLTHGFLPRPPFCSTSRCQLVVNRFPDVVYLCGTVGSHSKSCQ